MWTGLVLAGTVVGSLAVMSGCTRVTVVDARPDRDSCERCHRAVSASGSETGIETAHGPVALSCTDCHGGDPIAKSKAEAHAVSGVTELRGETAVGLTQVDGRYVRFANPADLRAAQVSCGAGAGGTCHAEIVMGVERTLSATFAGALTGPRELMGSLDPPVGVVEAADAHPGALVDGAVPEIERFPHPATVGATDAELLDQYLRKACARCHLNDYGTSQLAGDFRGSGCAACHVSYAADGRSRTNDSAGEPAAPAPIEHRLVRSPEEAACARCHVGGARIALSYRGAAPASATGYLEVSPSEPVVTEHDPDIHAQAGMTCTDCHTGAELHGGPELYASRHATPSLRCDDCHGSGEARIEPDGDGLYRAAAGWVLAALERGEDGGARLRTKDGLVHVVPQLATGDAPPEAHGSEHARVACASCHSTFTITCVGCHVTVDEQPRFDPDDNPLQPMASLIDGLWQAGGAIDEEGFTVDTSLFLLGEAPDGTVYPIVPAQAVFMSHISPEGEPLRDREILRRDGEPVIGLAAVEPHTVGPARTCDDCHIRPDGSNEDTVRRLIGSAGSGATVEDGAGTTWDLSELLDDQLDPLYPTQRGHARPLGRERARRLLEEPVE